MQILRTWALVAGAAASLGAQRENVRLDRDVIFLAEAGEEGTTRVGILYMANDHFPAIDAEYCLAEGGNVTRVGGSVKYASVETTEKIRRWTLPGPRATCARLPHPRASSRRSSGPSRRT